MKSNSTVAPYLNAIAAECHANSKAKGFWDAELNHGEKIALMHSELSETLEELRKPKVDWNAVTEELADVVIRIMDYCGGIGLDIGPTIISKMAKNASRPPMHGKAF